MIGGSVREWQCKISELREAIENMEQMRARSTHNGHYEGMRFFRKEKRFLELQLLIAQVCLEELERQALDDL